MCSRQLTSLIPHPLIPPAASAGTVSSTSVPYCVHTVLPPHPSFTLCHSLPFLFSIFLGQIFVVPQLVCFAHLIGNGADSRNAPSDLPRFSWVFYSEIQWQSWYISPQKTDLNIISREAASSEALVVRLTCRDSLMAIISTNELWGKLFIGSHNYRTGGSGNWLVRRMTG